MNLRPLRLTEHVIHESIQITYFLIYLDVQFIVRFPVKVKKIKVTSLSRAAFSYSAVRALILDLPKSKWILSANRMALSSAYKISFLSFSKQDGILLMLMGYICNFINTFPVNMNTYLKLYLKTLLSNNVHSQLLAMITLSPSMFQLLFPDNQLLH